MEKDKNQLKVNKRTFLTYISSRNGISYEEAERAYDMVTNALIELVIRGFRVSLVGFGSYYAKLHRGHPVQFEGKAEQPTYKVFRFTPSSLLNKRLREEMNERQET